MDEEAYRLVARIGARELRARVDRELLVGAAADCDLVLADPTVSRHHARVWPVAGGLRVCDLGSRNGTRIDGQPLAGEGMLAAGAVLDLGDVSLRVERLAAGDAGPALGAAPAQQRAAVAGSAEPTLVSAGLTRFCIREMEPLLAALAAGEQPQRFAARTLAALSDSEPGSGFRLTAGSGLLAQSGTLADAPLVLEAQGLKLELHGRADADGVGLRTIGRLALSLLVAACTRPAAAAVAARPAAGAAVGNGPAAPETLHAGLREIYWQARRVAPSRLNVLLSGESGTGKEVLARFLHAASGEPADRYLVLNCAALPSDLLDAELFGIESGVATGVTARPGRFELAHGGTLFLDEIGDMSLDTQARILRVLQEREVYRVGSHRARPADVRVVSATNRDLAAMVREGAFRLDLFHRIADWSAELPPLRARSADIGNLAAQFLADAMARQGARSGGLSPGAVEALARYDWPGNVRELEREMARVALFVEDGEVVVSTQLKPEILACSGSPAGDEGLTAQLEREERRVIARALAAAAGNVAQAAERLAVSKSTLYRRLQALGIDAG